MVSGCGREGLTEVLRNYIITYHVASGCGKKGLTEVFEKLHNHLPCRQWPWKGRTEGLRYHVICQNIATPVSAMF
jgi:hypothetical protein